MIRTLLTYLPVKYLGRNLTSGSRTHCSSLPSALCCRYLSLSTPAKYQKHELKFDDEVFTYTEGDVIRYALGVGASLPQDMRIMYEGHRDFCAIPSFLTTIGVNVVMKNLAKSSVGDFRKMLHQEQYLEVYQPIPTNATLAVSTKLIDVLDKRKFVQLIIENMVHDDGGDALARMQSVMLSVGNSHLGRRGKCANIVPPVCPPNRDPDRTYVETTSVNQAAWFRLSGDLNPLHIDEQFALEMGYPQPILHGLCCYGFALRHVLKCYADNNISSFRSMKVQFSKPVLPGETLTTLMWREGCRIVFQVNVEGRVVLSGGFVELDICNG